MEAVMEHYNLQVRREYLKKGIGVQGVGDGAKQCSEVANVPLGLPDGSAANFRTAVLPNSNIPALLGRRSLRRLHALIDVCK